MRQVFPLIAAAALMAAPLGAQNRAAPSAATSAAAEAGDPLAAAGFHRRRALGRQSTAYLTRADIAAARAGSMRELFYGRAGIRRGVQLQWTAGSRAVLLGRFGGAYEILLNGWSVPANGVAPFAPNLEAVAFDEPRPEQDGWVSPDPSPIAALGARLTWDVASHDGVAPALAAPGPYRAAGVRAWQPLSAVSLSGWQLTPTVDELVRPDVVAGIEIYWDGRQVPPELRRVRLGDGPLMVIWTADPETLADAGAAPGAVALRHPSGVRR